MRKYWVVKPVMVFSKYFFGGVLLWESVTGTIDLGRFRLYEGVVQVARELFVYSTIGVRAMI